MVNRRGSCELFGFDFCIDDVFKVWLIEVNCSPSLEHSTPVTARLVKSVCEDTAKVHRADPRVVTSAGSPPPKSARTSAIIGAIIGDPSAPPTRPAMVDRPALRCNVPDGPACAGQVVVDLPEERAKRRANKEAESPLLEEYDTGLWECICRNEVTVPRPLNTAGGTKLVCVGTAVERKGRNKKFRAASVEAWTLRREKHLEEVRRPSEHSGCRHGSASGH